MPAKKDNKQTITKHLLDRCPASWQLAVAYGWAHFRKQTASWQLAGHLVVNSALLQRLVYSHERCLRICIGVVIWALLSPLGYAQSSVERSETSQQARAPESELERAKAVVTKPNEPRPAPPETAARLMPQATRTI